MEPEVADPGRAQVEDQQFEVLLEQQTYRVLVVDDVIGGDVVYHWEVGIIGLDFQDRDA